MAFEPDSVEVFRFLPFEFDAATGVAKFHYSFDGGFGSREIVGFIETFQFPLPEDGIAAENLAAVERGLHILSLLAGVSYYKAAVPTLAHIESGPITARELALLETLYFHGLGEFSYVNKLDLRGRPQFKAEMIEARVPTAPRLHRRSLVAVGGGKDSCVSIEAMRSAGEVVLTSINRARPIVDVMRASGLPSIHVERMLSPELFRINAEGAYNGHVPITAVVSMALVVAALIQGCDAVVMSNERSASVGNVEYNGTMVNHQFSKSLQAEQLLADVIAESIAPNLDYFSLLRPFSELEITRRFAKLTRYHDVFTSCNRAFRIDESKRVERWCGDCPKCRFVFLSLAPNMDRQRLSEIFGKDMLDDSAQFAGFDELIGWDAFKPFECVGEVEESVAAFIMLSQTPQWATAAAVKRFAEDILPKLDLPDDVLTEPFRISTAHHIPEQYEGLLDATA